MPGKNPKPQRRNGAGFAWLSSMALAILDSALEKEGLT
jgi:hypothetical protein